MENNTNNAVKAFSDYILTEIKSKKGYAKRMFFLKTAESLKTYLGSRVFSLLAKTFFESAKKMEMVSIERYIKSIYFSKDYQFFKNITPSEAVRMVRYYFKRKDGTSLIPVVYAPLILKKARNIKKNIHNTIIYRAKKSVVVPEEVIFEELKREFQSMKRIFRVKKKKKPRKKVHRNLSS